MPPAPRRVKLVSPRLSVDLSEEDKRVIKRIVMMQHVAATGQKSHRKQPARGYSDVGRMLSRISLGRESQRSSGSSGQRLSHTSLLRIGPSRDTSGAVISSASATLRRGWTAEVQPYSRGEAAIPSAPASLSRGWMAESASDPGRSLSVESVLEPERLENIISVLPVRSAAAIAEGRVSMAMPVEEDGILPPVRSVTAAAITDGLSMAMLREGDFAGWL